MTARSTLRAAALVLLCGAAACGSDDANPIGTADGGADGGADSGGDSGGDVATPDADLPDADASVPDTGDDVAVEDTGGEDTGGDDTGQPDVGVDTDLPARCDADADCNDRLTCTVDACVDGACVWAVAGDACLVRGVCFDDGDADPGDPCAVCAPATASTAFSPAAEGASCDDGNLCTADATCVAGTCTGEAVTCDDGEACTDDICDPARGCVFPPLADGSACDDTSACTSGDRCDAGTCVGDDLSCDDGDPCTTNSCNPDTGCVSEPSTASCSDSNACTSGDVCAAGTCESGEPTNCEDGNVCTIDLCDEVAGCVHLPNRNPCCEGTVSICDDRDPCTTDICDPESGACFYDFNTAACDDGNACTSSDVCAEGVCGGRATTCDDGNVCTEDFCDPDAGCGTRPVDGGSCDDGLACTSADVCSGGACVAGVDECFCEPVLGQVALRITALEIPPDGFAGDGLNIDTLPTCAPAARCGDGVDNAMGPIGGVVNGPLADALDAGSLVLVIDLDDLARNPLRLGLVQGAADESGGVCDPLTVGCPYLADVGSYDPDTCAPLVTLPTTRAGTSLSAGSPDAVFPLSIPFGDTVLTLTLYAVQFRGTLVYDGADVIGIDAILGGAVPLDDLLAAIDALPPDSLPIDPASIRNLLTFLVTEDQTITLPGGRTRTAASIGLRLHGVRGDWTGVLR